MLVAYEIGWPHPHSHYFDITITVENPLSSNTVFRIPAWRPGRYVVENFSRNVVSFRAENEHGQPLAFVKLDKDSWKVNHESASKLLVHYQYYANLLDAGNSFLDDSEAYINPVNMLMYIVGNELLPVSLQLDNPDAWEVATALDFHEKRRAFLADNYHELADSPILVSPSLERFSFPYRQAIIEIVIQGRGNYRKQQLMEDLRKIVAEQVEIMKALPLNRYLFIYHLLPHRFGHGVEHRFSSSIVIGPADFDRQDFYRRFLGITAHEFFHLWNVERIRPVVLSPPDYAREAYTGTMWFFEGVTSYYDMLTLVRSGLTSEAQFFHALEKEIRQLQNSDGRHLTSATMAGWDSWTKFEKAPPNSSISFYNKGAILGLLLDLEIRSRTGNESSLDDVMRYLYRNYARKDCGVPEKGLQVAVEAVSGSSFDNFFSDYVSGVKEIDYNAYLYHAGLVLEKEIDPQAPAAFLGIQTEIMNNETVICNIIRQSPAFDGGLSIGDILVAIDDQRLTQDNLVRMLKDYHPGDRITVTVFRRNRLRHFDIILGGGGNTRWIIRELAPHSVSQAKIQTSWLNNIPGE